MVHVINVYACEKLHVNVTLAIHVRILEGNHGGYSQNWAKAHSDGIAHITSATNAQLLLQQGPSSGLCVCVCVCVCVSVVCMQVCM